MFLKDKWVCIKVNPLPVLSYGTFQKNVISASLDRRFQWSQLQPREFSAALSATSISTAKTLCVADKDTHFRNHKKGHSRTQSCWPFLALSAWLKHPAAGPPKYISTAPSLSVGVSWTAGTTCTHAKRTQSHPIRNNTLPLTCGGVQTFQTPIARQDPPQSAAQAASSSSTSTLAYTHSETSVHHAVHPSACWAPAVWFRARWQPRAATAATTTTAPWQRHAPLRALLSPHPCVETQQQGVEGNVKGEWN